MLARRFQAAASRQFSTSRGALDVARMTLLGRIGSDIEPSHSKAGVPYLRYPLAVRTGKEQTSWFNVVTFDPKLIEFMQKYVQKGSLVYVEADASINRFEAEDGSTRSSLNLLQQSINPVTWKNRNQDSEFGDAPTDGAPEA